MASDPETSVPVDAHQHGHSHRHGHAHGMPHSHGATVLRSVSTQPQAGVTTSSPAMSLLRLSIQARLVAAIVFAAIIWAAIHWATL